MSSTAEPRRPISSSKHANDHFQTRSDTTPNTSDLFAKLNISSSRQAKEHDDHAEVASNVSSSSPSSSLKKLTFASPEVKALSFRRSDQAYRHLTRAADVGQQLQLSLQNKPPQLYPEYEARRLVDFFTAWVQDLDVSHKGLAVINHIGPTIADVIPPWNFAWVDEYILDPSVKPTAELPKPSVINGYQLSDERGVLQGCSCENDYCDPETCECFLRGIQNYPILNNWYLRALKERKQRPDDPATALKFAYDENGLLTPLMDVGLPIFECNSACACDKHLCTNRVAQKGKQVSLAVCKMEGKGWGIKTLQNLRQGEFIGSYAGELIDDAESERRAQVYDKRVNTTYLQTLDAHIIKIFLTRRLVEEELAENKTLHLYRGTFENEERMRRKVTEVDRLIEGHDDYKARRKDLEKHIDELKKLGRCSAQDEQSLFDNLHRRIVKEAEDLVKDRIDLSDADKKELMQTEYPILAYLKVDERTKDMAMRYSKKRSSMEDSSMLTVDSGLFGNHTRFFNHSCDPNISQYPVYCEEDSIMRPILAFFTNRPVAEGEELCFDYFGGNEISSTDDVTPEPDETTMQQNGTRYAANGTASNTTNTSERTSSRHKQKTSVIELPSSTRAAHNLATRTDQTDPSAAANGEADESGNILLMKCRCGARNCRGKVFINKA